jgi:hypothetical protein
MRIISIMAGGGPAARCSGVAAREPLSISCSCASPSSAPSAALPPSIAVCQALPLGSDPQRLFRRDRIDGRS